MFWGLLLQLCYKVTAEYAAETILKKIRQCLVKLQLWCIPFYGTLYTDFYRAVLLLVGWWCRLQKLIPLQYNHTKPSTLLLETCHVSMLLIVATCYVETSFTVFLCAYYLLVILSTKSMNFGSRYLVHRLSDQDEIWHIDRGVFAVHQCHDWWTLSK